MYYEHIKGLNSENKVINHLQRQGWRLLHHRFKTKIAEIDLIFQKGHEFKMVEVKSISSWNFVSYRVSKKQKQRLIRVFHYFQQRFSLDITLELALVPANGDILFIEIENDC
ncbi:MAG: YraN family protein [Bdellovibrionaceae bacterium]|nr:YraN family protein [Pseudobdellovibrionaceae bacterium]